MKTRFLMMMAMVSIAFGGLFASCEKDETTYSKEQLVGKWDAQKMEIDGGTMQFSGYMEMYMIFRSNNTFTLYSRSYEAPEEEANVISGTWSLSGSALNLTYAGDTESMTIKELTQNTMGLSIKGKRRDDDGNIVEVMSYMYLTRDETYQE